MDDIITQDGDLEILDGDLKVDFGDHQNIEHILRANPGDYVETPLLGVAVTKSLNGPRGVRILEKEIRSQLKGDGFKVDGVELSSNEKITVNAKRIK